MFEELPCTQFYKEIYRLSLPPRDVYGVGDFGCRWCCSKQSNVFYLSFEKQRLLSRGRCQTETLS
ncbi:hypothetical protein Bca101_091723 [Brassica carinata]